VANVVILHLFSVNGSIDVAEQCMGSNSAQKNPQLKREIRLNILFDIRLFQCCVHCNYGWTFRHFRILFI